jgi:hypothetical protein
MGRVTKYFQFIVSRVVNEWVIQHALSGNKKKKHCVSLPFCFVHKAGYSKSMLHSGNVHIRPWEFATLVA